MEAVHSLVAIVFVCKDGLIVMKRRPSELLEPNIWAGPIGHVEPGETADAAALREFRQETGMVPKPEEMRFFNESEVSISDRGGKRHVLKFRRYSYRLPDSMSIDSVRLSREHTDKKIVGFEDLKRCHDDPQAFVKEFSQSGAHFVRDHYSRIVALCKGQLKSTW